MNRLFWRQNAPDWRDIEAQPWVSAMRDCPQDAIHHAEGDVWTHTRMVVDALLAEPDVAALPEAERHTLFLSALLHDVAKPATTVEEDGRIVSPKHAQIGEKMARELLWDYEFATREQICSLVRLHGLPLWSHDKENPNAAVTAASLRLRNDRLAVLARADVLGRIAADRDELLERIEFFRELCLENECWDRERAFHNDHSRYQFFRKDERYPPVIFDDTAFEVTIMSGLPGSGKDTYARALDVPMVSLDELRRIHKVKHGDRQGQGRIVQMAQEQAREYCRRKQSFVWNATNTTREMRDKIVGLLGVYNPYFTIVYVETSLENISARRGEHIRGANLHELFRRLDLPQRTEAHRVAYIRN
jgi:predicted kinase